MWLGATETETSSTTTGNPAIMTSSTFTDDLDALCPFDIYCHFGTNEPDGAGGGGMRELFLITTNSSDKILLVEADTTNCDLGATGTLSETVVATASAGKVVTYNPTGNTPVTLVFTASNFASFNANARTIDVYAGVHNTGADTPFVIEIGTSVGGNSNVIYTRAKIIDTTNYAEPRPVHLGRLGIMQDIDDHDLYLRLTATADYTDNLEIDYIVLVGVDSSTNVYHLPWLGLNDTPIGPIANRLYSEHRMLTDLMPRVYWANGAGTPNSYYGYEGAGSFWASGAAISAIALGVVGDTYVIEDSLANELNCTLSVTRTAAYLTPL